MGSVFDGRPMHATIGIATRYRIVTGIMPYLSNGRMMAMPPSVPPNWNSVVAHTA